VERFLSVYQGLILVKKNKKTLYSLIQSKSWRV